MSSPGDPPLTLFLAGDVMTGRGVDQILGHPGDPRLREAFVHSARTYVALAERAHGPVPAPVGPGYVWGDALAVLEPLAPAASIVNLETSITTSDEFWPEKAIHYRMHPDNVGCLRSARIDVCSLANNHVLDFGRSGLLETIEVLRRAGIGSPGAGRDLEEAWRPARVDLGGGATLLVLACGSATSGIPPEWAAGPERPGVALLSDLSAAAADEVVERVGSVKGRGDVAVASIHWGSNWGHAIPLEQATFARRLIDGGVDVVHGHSSHHVRPVEVHRRKLILYGCGDLVTDYEGIGGMEAWRGDVGALYLATLSRRGGELLDLRVVPMRMERLRLTRVEPADEEWLAAELDRIGGPFGTSFERRADGSLRLQTDHGSHGAPWRIPR